MREYSEPLCERETYCEIFRSGKLIRVSCYEKRYDCTGHTYYARYDGYQSKQRKRILDWAQKQTKSVREGVERFFDA